MTYNQDLADAAVLERLQLLRTEATLVQIVTREYLRVTQPVIDRLTELHRIADAEGRVFTLAERREVNALRATLTKETQAVHTQMRAAMYAQLRSSARTSALNTAVALRDLAPPALAGDVLAPALADVAQSVLMPVGGLRWTDRLAVDLTEQHDRLQAVLSNAAATGKSMPKVAEAIRSATTIQETYRGRFVAIARTEVQRVANAGAMTTYQANADIISAYMWLATLDSRTCVICASLHETVWPVGPDGGLPADAVIPPAHVNCRCFIVPVTKTWKELGLGSDADERRELDGRAASLMDFDSWLSRQPEDTQVSVLGSQAKRQSWLDGESLAAIAAPGVAKIPPAP